MLHFGRGMQVYDTYCYRTQSPLIMRNALWRKGAESCILYIPVHKRYRYIANNFVTQRRKEIVLPN